MIKKNKEKKKEKTYSLLDPLGLLLLLPLNSTVIPILQFVLLRDQLLTLLNQKLHILLQKLSAGSLQTRSIRLGNNLPGLKLIKKSISKRSVLDLDRDFLKNVSVGLASSSETGGGKGGEGG